MTMNDDAELLLDENFIAMDDNEPFDFAEDENSPFYIQPKYKKKGDFNFTSLWRKPKIGRRKSRSTGKNQVTHERISHHHSSLRSRGKYVKDRESFETFASVPLSDFDEAKDTLPFLHFRPGLHANHGEEGDGNYVVSENKLSSKQSKVLNPKMFLKQVPAKRKETKIQDSKFYPGGIMDEDGSRDIFKPIHNTNNNFDAFQILSKESPNKVNIEHDAPKKQKEVQADGQYDKENFLQDSIYCGDLYQDHGPILSSLSEDTTNTDSVRGERFLEENFDENIPEMGPTKKLNESNYIMNGKEEKTSNFHDASNRNNLHQDKLSENREPSGSIEPSVRSFSDRLKLFQSKANQSAHQSRYVVSKPKSRLPIGNVQDLSAVKNEQETDESHEITKVSEVSELEHTAPNQEKDENINECNIAKKADQTVEGELQVRFSESTNDTTNSYRHGRRKIFSSKVEHQAVAEVRVRNLFEKRDSSEQIDGKKSLTSNSFRDNSSKFGIDSEEGPSEVVDLSTLKILKNHVADNDMDQNESVVPTNAMKYNLSKNSKKLDSVDVREDSKSNNDQNIHALPSCGMRSYRTKSRWSSNYGDDSTKFEGLVFGRRDITQKVESKFKIENVEKTEHSEGGTQPLEEVDSNELEEHSVNVRTEASTVSNSNKSERNADKTLNSSNAARQRFGRRFENHSIKFGRKNVSTIKGDDTDESKGGSFEISYSLKLEISDDTENVKVVSQSHQQQRINPTKLSFDESKKKSSESLKIDLGVNEIMASSLNNPPENNKDSFSKTLNDREFSVRKSSDEMNVKKIAPSSEMCTPNTNRPEEISFALENEVDTKPEVSNEFVANTTISSLTCDSNPHSSFAQQSASIFGVTLSKTRHKRIRNTSSNKEGDRLNEQSVKALSSIEKSNEEDVDIEFHPNGVDKVHTEVNCLKNENEENQNIADKENILEKNSIFFKSTSIVDGKRKEEALRVQQEDDPVIVEHHHQNDATIHRIDECNKNNEETSFSNNDCNSKVEPVSLPRKVKSLSISDRLKMFEKAATGNRMNFSRNNDVRHQDTAHTVSPKSVETYGSSSFDDTSISTKRRSSETKSINNNFTQLGLNSPDDTCNDDGVDRRKTLKSIQRGSRDSAGLIQAQRRPYELPIHGLDKSEILLHHGNGIYLGCDNENVDNKPESRSERPTSEQKEKIVKEHAKDSCKNSSPPRTAYSARRKFFENLDRKRNKAFMPKSLITQPEPMPLNMKLEKEEDIENIHDSEGLPMFVTVEEDFMLKDNISTCLSASESRSVVCKPNAFLYSVSQKAIALMSAKAERNSTMSFSKSSNGVSKETIDRNLTQGLNSSYNDPSKNTNLTTTLCNSAHCTQNKMTRNGDNLLNQGNNNAEILIDNLPARKCRTSNISQHSNPFTRKKKTSENCRESKCDERVDKSNRVNDTDYVKKNSSVESKLASTIGKTSTFYRSRYNRFEKEKIEAERCQESNFQQPSDEDKLSNLHKDVQHLGVKSKHSLESLKINECKSKDLHRREEKSAESVKNQNDEVLNTNKIYTPLKEDECIQEKQRILTNKNEEAHSDKHQTQSMSISARRTYFESRCAKVVSVNMNTVKTEVKTESPKISSSVTDRDSEGGKRENEDSESTPSDSTSVAEKSEPATNENVNNATSIASDSQKKVVSKSNSRPSDISWRTSSASTYTRGNFALSMYRRGFSSIGVRSSTDDRDKEKAELRCF